jgi:hypothetical protein
LPWTIRTKHEASGANPTRYSSADWFLRPRRFAVVRLHMSVVLFLQSEVLFPQNEMLFSRNGRIHAWSG